MTRDEIMQLSAEECETRRAAIRSEMDAEDADIDALSGEAEAIVERLSVIRESAEKRAALAAKVAAGEVGTVKETFKEDKNMDEKRTYSVESPEYRMGFLKTHLGQDDQMTVEERNAVAYVATTGDSTNGAANALPRQMVNAIWDLIDEQHSILGDIDMYRTGTIMEFVTRSAITQGDAASVNENAANDDEINTIGKVTLSGKDFSKHVNISYAMAKMSVDAFEAFLIREIGERIGAALAGDVLSQINTDYYSTGNAVSTAASGKIAYADVANALSVLKNANGPCVIYGSHATIYKYLVGMVDSTGRPVFQPNAQAGAQGTLVGFPVKVEDGISGNVLWIGYPKQVVGNMVQDVMIESDKDIKKHVITYAGYARFECKLIAPKAFAKLTVTP